MYILLMDWSLNFRIMSVPVSCYYLKVKIYFSNVKYICLCFFFFFRVLFVTGLFSNILSFKIKIMIAFNLILLSYIIVVSIVLQSPYWKKDKYWLFSNLILQPCLSLDLLKTIENRMFWFPTQPRTICLLIGDFRPRIGFLS